MKLLKLIFFAAMCVMMATSCSDGDDNGLKDNYTEQEYVNCFNYVYNVRSGNGSVISGTSYMFRFRMDGTADVYVKNAKFAPQMPDGINFEFEGLKWSLNSSGYKVIAGVNLTPMMNGNPVEGYVVDNLKIELMDRYLGSIYLPVINMSMMVNGAFEIVTIPMSITYFGKTGVVNEQANTNFTTKNPYYIVKLDPKTMTASIDIRGAKFAENMPAMDMVFPGVEFEVSRTGYDLNADSLIPEIAGVPYPNYSITGLHGEALFETGLNLQFNCMGVFTVQANLGYVSVSQAE